MRYSGLIYGSTKAYCIFYPLAGDPNLSNLTLFRNHFLTLCILRSFELCNNLKSSPLGCTLVTPGIYGSCSNNYLLLKSDLLYIIELFVLKSI